MNVELISPFPFEALPRVWHWILPWREKVADDYAPKTLGDFVAHMAAGWGRQKTWAIVGDGELGGLIIFERLDPWRGTAHAILKPDFQGKGIAGPAYSQAVGEMFAEGIGKLGFHVLSGNFAMGSVLASIGARREGTLEAHTLRNGKPTDLWVYGLTKQNYEARNGISTGSVRTNREDHHISGAAAAIR